MLAVEAVVAPAWEGEVQDRGDAHRDATSTLQDPVILAAKNLVPNAVVRAVAFPAAVQEEARHQWVGKVQCSHQTVAVVVVKAEAAVVAAAVAELQ